MIVTERSARAERAENPAHGYSDHVISPWTRPISQSPNTKAATRITMPKTTTMNTSAAITFRSKYGAFGQAGFGVGVFIANCLVAQMASPSSVRATSWSGCLARSGPALPASAHSATRANPRGTDCHGILELSIRVGAAVLSIASLPLIGRLVLPVSIPKCPLKAKAARGLRVSTIPSGPRPSHGVKTTPIMDASSRCPTHGR